MIGLGVVIITAQIIILVLMPTYSTFSIVPHNTSVKCFIDKIAKSLENYPQIPYKCPF